MSGETLRSTSLSVEGTGPSLKRCYGLLLALWSFHALNNVYYLLTTDPPPNFDCGYHLQLSLSVYDRLFDFDSDNYALGLLTSTGFYPFFAYFAAIPFYLIFGFSQDAAIAGNLIFLAVLLWATFEIGRTIQDSRLGLISAALLSFFPFVFGISRNYYIESGLMAVTAFSMLCLLRCKNFSQRNWSLLFGLSVGLGMMTKWSFAFHLVLPVAWTLALGGRDLFRESWDEKSQSKSSGLLVGAVGIGLFACALGSDRGLLWAVPAILFSLLGIAFLVPSRPIRDRLTHWVLSGFVAMVVCYPWYIRYWDHISGVAAPFLDSEITHQASPFTIAAFLYYPFVLESNQLGPALFLAFLAAILLFPWKEVRKFGLMGMWLIGSFLVTANIPYKDPRYIAPFLPAVSLLMGFSFLNLPWIWLRRAVLLVTTCGAIWQFGMMTFEWPLPSSNHWRLGPFGYTYSFWNHGIYGTGRERTEIWPHREIVQDFKDEVLSREHNPGKPQLRCLIDYHGIHQGIFEFIAQSERGNWGSVFDRVAYRLDYELNRWADCEAILFPSAPLEGDLYRMRDGRWPSEFNRSEASFLRVRFPEQKEYRVPSGETVILAFRDPTRTVGEDPKLSFRFSNRMEILSGKIQVTRKGKNWVLEIDTQWRYLHIDNWPTHEINRVWIDLFTPEGEWIESKPFPLKPGFETDQVDSMFFEWTLPSDYQDRVFQVGLHVGSEQPESRVEIKSANRPETVPNLFCERLIYIGE